MNNGKKKLYSKIKNQLLESIQDLKPHERIPSRTALIQQYNVTRTTIERAISELIGEGVLYSRDGSGTYVAENAHSGLNGKTGASNWGVIIPDILNDTYPGILRGIEDVANQNGISILVGNTDNRFEKQEQYLKQFMSTGVKGMIIIPAIPNLHTPVEDYNLASFADLLDKKIPLVFCNRALSGVLSPTVMSNDFYGGYLATRHLIRSGYEKIAFVSRPKYTTTLKRYQGYLAALAESGYAEKEGYVEFSEDWNQQNPGYLSGRKVLKREDRPDAIFCFNDGIARGVYLALEELSLVPGKDIGVVGYDDTDICEMLPVKLTSIKFQKYNIGKKAGELMIEMQNREEWDVKKTVIFQPELVIRESCQDYTGK